MVRGSARPVIVGYGSSTYQKVMKHELLWHLWSAARDCLERSRLVKDVVDGLALASFMYPPGNVVTLADHFGMRIRWAEQGAYGGASGVVALGKAADAIRLGRADAVLCLAGDTLDVARHDEMTGRFTPVIRDYLAPHGFGGPTSMFAMIQRRHSYLYGTTREQLGTIAVTQRSHAMQNLNALLREPLTIEKYLNARPIAEPLHLYDCVLPCSGADAVVVVREEIARATGRPYVEILSVQERHNAHPEASSSLPGGWELFADDLFREARVTRNDVDLAELYDDYPIMVGIQLERYGFCPEGRCGEFIVDTDLSIGGDLPVNTGGGQLSCGQAGASGGTIGIVEAVKQLQREAGARQVGNAEVALVSGFGLVSYGKALCTAGAILATRE